MTNEENAEIITIGTYLKQMREKKKLTIKIVSQHTKINASKLELLEADRVGELPNHAYVVGYVKSYSRTLGLDQAYCLELLEKTYGKNDESIPQVQLQKLSEANKPKVDHGTDHSLAKIVAGVAAIAIVVGILAFLSQREQLESAAEDIAKDEPAVIQEQEESLVQVDSVDPETELAPEQNSPEVAPPPTPVTPVAQKEEAKVAAKKENNKEETKEENSDETQDNQKKKKTFRQIIGPTYAVSTITDAEKDRVYPANLRSSGAQGEYHVYIKADTDATWITYKTDDEDARRFVLEKDRYVMLKGRVHRIFLGNANATKIFVNEELIDVETRTGVKSVVVPNSVRSDYYLPLFIYPGDGTVKTSQEVMKAEEETAL